MYYPDLSPYRIGRNSKGFSVFPQIKNIGWLSPAISFNEGSINYNLLKNLKEILFIDIANRKNERNPNHPEITISESYVRSHPIDCPICNKAVTIKPNNLSYYQGFDEKHLGNSEIEFPSIRDETSYCFPALLYHYIEAHNYKPPNEFIETILNFDPTIGGDLKVPSHSRSVIKVNSEDLLKMDREVLRSLST
jgi:hypothetical protein